MVCDSLRKLYVQLVWHRHTVTHTHKFKHNGVYFVAALASFKFAPPLPARAGLAGLALAVVVVDGSAARPALHAQDPSPCSHPCNVTLM